MNSDDSHFKENAPIHSGIQSHLIAKRYKLGSTFLIKDDSIYDDIDGVKNGDNGLNNAPNFS